MDISILKNYTLPDGVSPYAPRQPFIDVSENALGTAIQFVADYPEARGTLTQALWSLRKNEVPQMKSKAVTLEAHVDATILPQNVINKLVGLGFQPDSFVHFNPAHLSDHLTLKFKADGSSVSGARRKELRHIIDRHGEQAYQILNGNAQVKEAYVELEIYPSTKKIGWNGAFQSGWRNSFPLPENLLRIVDVPTTQEEAKKTGIALTARKHSDIHIKIARNNSETQRQALLKKLSAVGFYPVFTASGNDVCTAQFAKATDAKTIFKTLSEYFPRYGGCSEMTWEVVAGMSRTERNGHYAAVPPLVMGLN